jgi:ribosomal protein L40E
MPIQVKCNCGQALNVPDNLAGKTGKCPKCQSPIKIPAPAGAQAAKPAKPGEAAAKPAPQKVAAAAAPATAGMDDLFDQIGLKKQTGPICPKCSAPVTRTATLCTKCGYNLQTGEQAVGVNFTTETPEFQNEFLREAASNMQRDVVSEERHSKAGLPWWMLASVLIGALCIAAAGVVIVDATFNEPAPANTFLGKVQRQGFGVIIGATLAIVGLSIASFAHLSIVSFAFGRSVGKGFAALLVPFYAFIYACKTWADNKTGIMGLVIGAILAGVGAALYQSSGGWR